MKVDGLGLLFFEKGEDAAGYTVGVDLGQSHEFTSLAVDRWSRTGGIRVGTWGDENRVLSYSHELAYLHRFPVGTSFPAVIEAVCSLVRQLPGDTAPTLFVDLTSVGRPVLDGMSEAGLKPVGIALTAGVEVMRPARDDVRLPKRVLAALMQMALQSGRLKIAADLPLTALLAKELAAFKVKASLVDSGNFEAWRESAHDDLVLASAVAVWGAENPPVRAIRYAFG